MQGNHLISLDDGRSDQAHGAFAAIRRTDVDVHREPPPVADRIGAQLLHRGTTFGCVQRNGERAGNRYPALQPENIIDPVGPAQAVVAKVAMPQAKAAFRQFGRELGG